MSEPTTATGVISPGSSVSSFRPLATPRTTSHSVSSTAADPHFPVSDVLAEPLPSQSQLDEEIAANERERAKMSRRRRQAQLLSSKSASLYSRCRVALVRVWKSLRAQPLSEQEGVGVAGGKGRRGRRRHKSTTKQRRWETKASNDNDTLPDYYSSPLLYFCSPPILQRVLSHFFFFIAVLFCNLVLGILLMLRLATNGHDKPLKDAAVAVLALFTLELVLRVWAYGRAIVKERIFLICSVITAACYLFILNAFQLSIVANNTIALTLQVIHMALRFLSIILTITTSARHMVSTNKTRYTLHGFDLDLTYITPRIIAMGLPSTSIEGLYRNPIDEVVRFFNTLHADHYLIINLCSERRYPGQHFNERVLCFPFDDHNPPPLSTIVEFCSTVDRFLQEDDRNVVAIHCKGGKGRTGTMIACWLLYASMSEAEGGSGAENSVMFAEQAMKLFAGCRTDKGRGGKLQGVSGPSQKRYVHYFEQLKWQIRKEEEEADEERKERERKRMEKKRKEEETMDTYRNNEEEHKEETEPSTTVSPVSLSTRHSYAVPRPTYAIPAHSEDSEEKEHHDTNFIHTRRSTAPSTASTASSSSSASDSSVLPHSSPSLSPRKSSHARHSRFLSHASSFLYHSPKCEVLSVVLNNAYVSKEHEGLTHGDERSRDEWNDTWNSRDNWSLVITHYRPILPRSAVEDDDSDDEQQHRRRYQQAAEEREEEKRESDNDAGSNKLQHRIDIRSSSSHSASRSHKPLTQLLPRLNEYNHHRYSDVHEYYFKARPRAADADPDDTSVTFDISSFESNSRSLILGGDLKFSIWRGKFDVDSDETDGLTSSGSGGKGKGKGKGKGGGGSGAENEHIVPQRKLSRVAHPLGNQTPRLFGWFWINTSFLPLSLASNTAPAGSPVGSLSVPVCRPAAARPSELILRKNQLDESFQAADIDSEFNVYVHYYLPALHKEAVQIEELHRDQMMRIKRMEDERKRKERDDRRRKAESKAKEAAGAVHAAATTGKKGRSGEAVEMADVVSMEVAEDGLRTAGGVFGQLQEDEHEEQREASKVEKQRKKRAMDEHDSDERKESNEASGGGVENEHGASEGEDDEDEEDEDGELDEEEEEVEAEEAEVEAEEGLAEFVA